MIPKRYSAVFFSALQPSRMQKQYVIGYSAPAVEIALQLAPRDGCPAAAAHAIRPPRAKSITC